MDRCGSRRMRTAANFLVGAALGVLTLALAHVAAADEREWTAAINRGRALAPVPLKIPAGVSPASVYVGSFIVNGVAGCNDCHSSNPYTATGNPYKGQPKQINGRCYLNGGQAFGPYVSRNITPDKSGRPAGVAFDVFVAIMQKGRDPDKPGALLQVMPWPVFQNMSIAQLKAIYDYLSSIPPLPNGGAKPC